MRSPERPLPGRGGVGSRRVRLPVRRKQVPFAVVALVLQCDFVTCPVERLASRRGLNALLPLARDADSSVRQAAGHRLAYSLNPEPALGDTLADLLDDEDQQTRIWAVHGLAERNDPRCIDGADRVGPVDEYESWCWLLGAPQGTSGAGGSGKHRPRPSSESSSLKSPRVPAVVIRAVGSGKSAAPAWRGSAAALGPGRTAPPHRKSAGPTSCAAGAGVNVGAVGWGFGLWWVRRCVLALRVGLASARRGLCCVRSAVVAGRCVWGVLAVSRVAGRRCCGVGGCGPWAVGRWWVTVSGGGRRGCGRRWSGR
ncbi:HEAT repeat domain-containing protein [Kitasatospora sp. NPDC092039]|uniref:HEAT repeat domain-containing protein n=1 Tax=Kitasatospora sp. NPDC092039 TaxID=3364086 RepID=UPI0037F4B8C0